jgi:hypothetical protein
MNCLFCQSFIEALNDVERAFSFKSCTSDSCKHYDVTYAVKDNHLKEVWFTVYKPNFAYMISYYLKDKMIEVEVGISPEPGAAYGFKSLFKTSYNSISISPLNIQEKLPTLLTFL